MRLSREELLKRYTWNEEKHDIVKAFYGDIPVVHYDESEYKRYLYFAEKGGQGSGIGTADGYIYHMNGVYDDYRTLIGNVKISENGKVLCGDISVTYYGRKYDIILNEMYGYHSLTILYLGTGKVKGWCNIDGQGSPCNKFNTDELDNDTILKILDSKDINDYGASIHKFINRCKELYNENTTNYIMQKTFEL